jgi:hypothetical protein
MKGNLEHKPTNIHVINVHTTRMSIVSGMVLDRLHFFFGFLGSKLVQNYIAKGIKDGL